MVDRLFWIFCLFFANLLFQIKLKRVSTTAIPSQAIFIANHVSSLDWLIIKAFLNVNLSFIAHHTFFNLPLLGKFMKLTKCIPIGPELHVVRKSFKMIHKHLSTGRSICIFPEGGLTPDGSLQKFKPGIHRIIDKHQDISVVPLTLSYLWDTHWSIQNGWFWQKPIQRLRPTIEITIGEPISIEVYTKIENKDLYLYHLIKKHHKP